MNRKMSTIKMSMSKIIKKNSRSIPNSRIILKRSLKILLNQVRLEEKFGVKVHSKILIEENKIYKNKMN
jgi:hypothetical protein